MSVYINIETLEYPRYEGDIRLIHPEIGEQFICPPCFVEIQETPQPVCGEYEHIKEGELLLDNDVYKQTWILVPYTDEEKLKKDTLPKNPAFWDSEKQEWVLENINTLSEPVKKDELSTVEE
jgi:hypothetical protein